MRYKKAKEIIHNNLISYKYQNINLDQIKEKNVDILNKKDIKFKASLYSYDIPLDGFCYYNDEMCVFTQIETYQKPLLEKCDFKISTEKEANEDKKEIQPFQYGLTSPEITYIFLLLRCSKKMQKIMSNYLELLQEYTRSSEWKLQDDGNYDLTDNNISKLQATFGTVYIRNKLEPIEYSGLINEKSTIIGCFVW